MLMTEDAPQRVHSLREVFNGLRWMVRSGAPWRLMPNDLPPWEAVYRQTQRWLNVGVFEAMVHDLRVLLRLARDAMSSPRRSRPEGQGASGGRHLGTSAGLACHTSQ